MAQEDSSVWGNISSWFRRLPSPPVMDGKRMDRDDWDDSYDSLEDVSPDSGDIHHSAAPVTKVTSTPANENVDPSMVNKTNLSRTSGLEAIVGDHGEDSGLVTESTMEAARVSFPPDPETLAHRPNVSSVLAPLESAATAGPSMEYGMEYGPQEVSVNSPTLAPRPGNPCQGTPRPQGFYYEHPTPRPSTRWQPLPHNPETGVPFYDVHWQTGPPASGAFQSLNMSEGFTAPQWSRMTGPSTFKPASSTYIYGPCREKELKCFNGKMDLMDYLNYFLKLAKLNSWDYETRGLQLATSLMGDAAEALTALPMEQSEDLQCLVQYLIRQYYLNGKEAQYSYELMSRTWNAGKETVTEFANSLTWLAHKAYPPGGVPENILVDMFKRGLVPSMQMEMHLHCPNTMESAVALAVAMEPFETALSAGKNPTVSDKVVVIQAGKFGVNSGTEAKASHKYDKHNDYDFELFREFLKWKTDFEGCRYCKDSGHWMDSCEKLKAKKAREAAKEAATPADDTPLN